MQPTRFLLALKLGTLIAVAVGAVAVALPTAPHVADAGSIISITSVTIEPTAPTETDPVSITVEGSMSQTCDVDSSHELFEDESFDKVIFVSVFLPVGSACLQVPGTFSVTEEIGLLPAGSYGVAVYATVCSPTCYESATFEVTSTSVGGVADLPDVARTASEAGGSSRPGVGVLAGAAVAAAIMGLGGAAWWARRRA